MWESFASTEHMVTCFQCLEVLLLLKILSHGNTPSTLQPKEYFPLATLIIPPPFPDLKTSRLALAQTPRFPTCLRRSHTFWSPPTSPSLCHRMFLCEFRILATLAFFLSYGLPTIPPATFFSHNVPRAESTLSSCLCLFNSCSFFKSQSSPLQGNLPQPRWPGHFPLWYVWTAHTLSLRGLLISVILHLAVRLLDSYFPHHLVNSTWASSLSYPWHTAGTGLGI